MVRSEIKTIHIAEGVPPVFVGRFEQADGTVITPSMVSSVELKVFRMDDGIPTTEVYADSPIDPTTVYSTTLQYDYESLLGDSGGRNFLLIIDNDAYEFQGGNTYRVQITSFIGSGRHVERANVVVGEVF
jgi:hypothetical protein